MAAERFWDRAAETLAGDDLERVQMARVRACVARLQSLDAEFYRTRIAGLRIEDLRSTDDLARLPFTTKADLRDHYPFGLFAAPPREIVRIHASSGSTGKPTVVAYTRADLELWANVLARGLVAGGLRRGDVFQNAYGYGLFTGGLGFHDAASRVGAAVVPTASGNTARQLMLMRDFGTTAFAATPSYAINVAELAQAEGIDLRSLPLRAAFVGAEPMSPALRDEIETRMGVRVFEQYGLSEIIGPGVAAACEASAGLHLWEDQFIAEIVDPESGERLPDDAVGELVLSAPAKEAFPLLRYRTRDRVRLTREPCACGRTMARIVAILGRTDDMLIVRGVNVFPSQIEHALLGVEGVDPQYQIALATRADRQDELRVRIEAEGGQGGAPGGEAADRAGLAARAREALQSALGLAVVIEVVAPGSLPRSEGKAVRVVDERLSRREER